LRRWKTNKKPNCRQDSCKPTILPHSRLQCIYSDCAK